MPKLRTLSPLLVLTLAPLLTGCVAQNEYDDLSMTIDAQRQRIADLERNLGDTQLLAERRQQALSDRQTADEQKDSQITSLRTQIGALRDQLLSIDNSVRNAGGGLIDPETDLALRSLAAQFPGMLSYDSETGRVLVASDLSFASGSAQITDAAKPALRQLARVLQSSAVSGLDVRVEGHTDSQVVSNPNVKRLFPTNRHLSVARAISVSDALQASGVAAQRILVAGWGPHRPLVPNNATGGTPQNRRVEIFLVPSQATATAPAVAPATDYAESAPDRSGDIPAEDYPIVK